MFTTALMKPVARDSDAGFPYLRVTPAGHGRRRHSQRQVVLGNAARDAGQLCSTPAELREGGGIVISSVAWMGSTWKRAPPVTCVAASFS